MQALLRRAWSAMTIWGALLGAALLALAAAGMLPAREPEAPAVERFAPARALSAPSALLRVEPRPAEKPAPGFEVSWVPLCEAPALGARLDWVRPFHDGHDALLVWCKDGYGLFSVSFEQDALHATRLAHFRARGELPGGAAAGDFDGDGQLDLALGVAPRPGVVHRAGSGVFWLRGRAQGGFEPARILAETPTFALAAQRSAGSKRHELLVLTSGDLAAQRQAELWLFGGQPVLSRDKVFQVGLDPRGLLLRPSEQANAVELWLLSGQPGRLSRMTLDLAARELRTEQALSLRGAQAFAREPDAEQALYVRDTVSVYRVERGAEPALAPFAQDLNPGPVALADLDGDAKPDLLAAIDSGLALRVGEQGAPRERALPAGLRVLDVATLREPSGRVRPLCLVQGEPDAAGLSLWLLPGPPWPPAREGQAPAAELHLRQGTRIEAERVAEVALE